MSFFVCFFLSLYLSIFLFLYLFLHLSLSFFLSISLSLCHTTIFVSHSLRSSIFWAEEEIPLYSGRPTLNCLHQRILQLITIYNELLDSLLKVRPYERIIFEPNINTQICT
jgi:hypothetical protein